MSDEWYYKNSGNVEIGPISALELKQLAKNGTITGDTLIKKGDGNWLKGDLIKGLIKPITGSISKPNILLNSEQGTDYKENIDNHKKIKSKHNNQKQKNNISINKYIFFGCIFSLFFLAIILYTIFKLNKKNNDENDEKIAIKYITELKTKENEKQKEESNMKEAAINAKVIKSAAMAFKTNTGNWPSDLKELVPTYLEKQETLVDPWGQQFQFQPADSEKYSTCYVWTTRNGKPLGEAPR